MTANKYFNHYLNTREQALIDDLVAEAIQIHGINSIYIPRSGDVDLFYGEDPRAKFDRWFEIVMYIKNAEGFNGRAMLQKWGITLEQSITLQMAKRDFIRAVGEELNPNRPREGDLIMLPYGVSGHFLLEIKYVRDDTPCEQLGQEYLYEVDCRMFTYGNEELKTGLPKVDSIAREIQQELEISFGAGTGNYLIGEIVSQGASFATSTFKAVVKEINTLLSTVRVSNMAGTFKDGGTLIGNTSGAIRSVGGNQQSIQNDPRAQNSLIEDVADPVIIRDPRNPFDRGDF